ARLRSPAYDGVVGETTFRDAAQGLVVWALGVVAMAAIVGALGLFAASATAHVAAGAAVPRSEPGATTATAAPVDYFVDLMFRPRAAPATAGPASPDTVGAAPSGIQPTLSAESRAEVTRILLRGVSQAGLA